MQHAVPQRPFVTQSFDTRASNPHKLPMSARVAAMAGCSMLLWAAILVPILA